MKMTPDMDAQRDGFATVGPDVVIPRRLRATFEPDGPDDTPAYRVTLEAVLTDGRFACASLTAERVEGGPEVSGAGLRTIAVGHLIRAVAEHNIYDETQAREAERGERSVLTPLSWRLPNASDGPTDRNLRLVATTYSLAYACGIPPTQAVERSLGLAKSTAGRWVRSARQRGYLEPTDQGRAGGVPSEDV